MHTDAAKYSQEKIDAAHNTYRFSDYQNNNNQIVQKCGEIQHSKKGNKADYSAQMLDLSAVV